MSGVVDFGRGVGLLGVSQFWAGPVSSSLEGFLVYFLFLLKILLRVHHFGISGLG